MSDYYFRELLGVKPDTGKDEIKRAYHRLARENHPDLYAEEEKPFQELKMMALNEAYAYLVSLPPQDYGLKESPETAPAAPVGRGNCPRQDVGLYKDVGLHKDPSYAYYKQGFVHFSRALHGIEAIYKKFSFKPLRNSYQRFAGSLGLLRRAHTYFSRVVAEYPQSIWKRDAEIKIKRIERFSALYRKILENLKESSS